MLVAVGCPTRFSGKRFVTMDAVPASVIASLESGQRDRTPSRRSLGGPNLSTVSRKPLPWKSS